MRKIQYIIGLSVLLWLVVSCIDKDVYKGNNGDNLNPGYDDNRDTEYTEYIPYLYPYSTEAQNVMTEITLEIDEKIDDKEINAEIPFLKYNKSWLFMLTQDDCMHAAYCRTWAAINGKPISNSDGIIVKTDSNYQLFYGAEQLAANDLPPDVFYLNKALGSTDGTGNEVRFAFTTTLSPEWDWMNASADVNKGYSDNYYRFSMKKGLTWNNVKEMLNYGTGIAFHDLNTDYVQDVDMLIKHFHSAQDSIVKHLSGRGSKMLAEPDGNKTYIAASHSFPDVQTMTAQTEAVRLYPFQVDTDLHKVVLYRFMKNDPNDIKPVIKEQLLLPKEGRGAILVGVHNTSNNWVDFLLWLNNTYGKDGDDSVWFPSLEEYYEYNYYRIHGTITKEINGNTVKLKISLPSGQYFYYPSVTVNLSGIRKEQIQSIKSNDAITGFSIGNYEESLMLNIDCRKYLVEHATHFVEKYESSRSQSNKNDALYFVNMLKESSTKTELLQRIK